MNPKKRPRTLDKHKTVAFFCVFFGFAVVYFSIKGLETARSPRKDEKILQGKPAFAFRLKALENQKGLAEETGPAALSLSDYKGKPLILNFWASWCTSCRSEASALQSFWEEKKQKINILGVAVHDEISESRKFAQVAGKTYPLALDEDGATATEFGVTGVPETVFIDSNGIIRSKKLGPVSREDLENFFEEIVNHNSELEKATH